LFENIEKSYLLNLLGERTPVIEFIKPEAEKILQLTYEKLEDLANINFDTKLKEAIKDKDIYFFSRLKPEFTFKRVLGINSIAVKGMSRFNFLVFNKEVV